MILRLNGLKIKQLTCFHKCMNKDWLILNCVEFFIKQLFCSVLVRYKFYMWSNRVMREVVRYGWKTAQGRRNKRVNMIVTPAVQVVRLSLCFRYMYHCYTSTQNILYNINILFLYTQKILLYYYEFIRFHYIVSNAFTLINFTSFLKKGILVTQFLKKRKFEFLPFLNFALRTLVNKIPACHTVLLNFLLRI